jgi:hypothetical protein
MEKLTDFKSFIAIHKRTFRIKDKARASDQLIVRRRLMKEESEHPPKHLPYHAVLHHKLTPPHPLLRPM